MRHHFSLFELLANIPKFVSSADEVEGEMGTLYTQLLGMQIGKFCMEVTLAILAKLDMDLLFLDKLQIDCKGMGAQKKPLVRFLKRYIPQFTTASFTIAKI